MTFGFTKTSNVLGDLGPMKTLQPNFGFVSVTNKIFDKNSPRQIKKKIAKRWLTDTKLTYKENKKKEKNSIGWKDRPKTHFIAFLIPLIKSDQAAVSNFYYLQNLTKL
jgi:hypothetical protein